MIFGPHVKHYKEMFALPGFLASPLLCFGYQEVHHSAKLDGKDYEHLGAYFEDLGLDCTLLDLFDARSKLRYDMNKPVPVEEHGRYKTFIDIGNIEHVFDTKQCMENCLRMVALGGHYMLHTCVNGYFAHGFHVFNPEALLAALDLNGFTTIFERYTTEWGEPAEPSTPGDRLIWLAARKDREMGEFVCPQQGMWQARYANVTAPQQN